MSFMVKKKKYRFDVQFEIDDLSSVPYMSGVLFSKIRLLDGGTYVAYTTREDIFEHRVKWKAKFRFPCKMVANGTTGILEPCVCRISVRKEIKGGKSFQKLGFVMVNLAEYAGSGVMSRRYLLMGYNSRVRLDNSILKVTLDTTLLSGDPCFKAPTPKTIQLPAQNEQLELRADNKGGTGSDVETGGRDGAESLASGTSSGFNSGFSSLEKPAPSAAGFAHWHSTNNEDASNTIPKSSDISERTAGGSLVLAGHSRNLSKGSHASQHSKVSGYSSAHTEGHSRQSSYNTDINPHPPTNRSISSGSLNRVRLDKVSGTLSDIEKKLGSTRVDADDLVEELLQKTDFNNIDESNECLQLFVGNDGSTALSSQQMRERAGRTFEQVVIKHD